VSLAWRAFDPIWLAGIRQTYAYHFEGNLVTDFNRSTYTTPTALLDATNNSVKYLLLGYSHKLVGSSFLVGEPRLV
jgi:hypothetical protein